MSNYWVILQTKIHIICGNAYVCIYGLLHFLSAINKFVFTQMCICTYARCVNRTAKFAFYWKISKFKPLSSFPQWFLHRDVIIKDGCLVVGRSGMEWRGSHLLWSTIFVPSSEERNGYKICIQNDQLVVMCHLPTAKSKKSNNHDGTKPPYLLCHLSPKPMPTQSPYQFWRRVQAWGWKRWKHFTPNISISQSTLMKKMRKYNLLNIV